MLSLLVPAARLVMLSLLILGAHATHAQNPGALPAAADLAEGWHTLRPGGETLCAHGGEFEFYARRGDPLRVLVYLYGGGGCWDAEGCQEGSQIYVSAIAPDQSPDRLGGILDLHHPENPFSEYSMVAVPVCTGDAHLGASDTRYELETAGGIVREFTVHHRGKTNVLSALDWITANFDEPSDIFVAGSSAGSLGLPFHASFLAQLYPGARVVSLGDDSGSYGSRPAAGVDASRWGLPGVLRRYPGWETFDEAMGIEALTITAAQATTNLSLFQVDHAFDQVQGFYIERAGVPEPDVLTLIRENRAAISSAVPTFRGFTIGGFRHTSLQVAYFFRYAEDGYPLRDWVATIAEGRDVPNVSCDDCERAGFIFDEIDLRIADRAIEMLSAADAWNPNDGGGSCAATPGQYSLRCVVFAAVRDVTGNEPGRYPYAWDVIYAAAERLGGVRNAQAVIHYNNEPDTSAADVLGLLREVRDRIANGLGATP